MSLPAKRALIVIDVQNEYVTGNFRIKYPDVQTPLFSIGKVMDATRHAIGMRSRSSWL